MTNSQYPLIGARVHLDDEHYAGPAIVLEFDSAARARLGVAGSYYCHLLDLCLFHEDGVDEACDDPNDECMGEACRGWYAMGGEGS